MDPYAQGISNIIKEQQAIIGPIALDQARKVSGLQIDDVEHIRVDGNKKEILTDLVNQYAKLFGRASVEVCKEALEGVYDKISQSDLPDILKS